MKKYYYCLVALILSSFTFSNIYAQSVNSEKKVSISFTWSRIQSYGTNQIAIWIEDTKGNHISTLFATRYTANGGYIKRPLSLSEWTAKFDLKNASKEQIDAVTGATPPSGKQIFTWNGKDKSGKVVPTGTYIVRMEANIHDADKMFFKGEIHTGGSDEQTKGEITFSSPSLSTGNTLFNNVLLEYK